MDNRGKTRSLSESTGEAPVAPPRRKKRDKAPLLRLPAQVQSHSAPCSPVPSAPRRPPGPRFSVRPETSTEARPVKDLLKHSTVEKSPSAPLRPSPPVRTFTTQSELKRAPERSKTPNPQSTSPALASVRRKNSLTASLDSPHQPQRTKLSGHSRTSSADTGTYSIYSTGPRPSKCKKGTPQRSRSEDESTRTANKYPTILDSRHADKSNTYLNVAPRLPPNAKKVSSDQPALSHDRTSLAKAYSQSPKSSRQRLSSEVTSRATPSKPQNLYQPSSPPKRPQNPPSRERNKQKVKPRRPAPPSPGKTAHLYTEIGPAEDEPEDVYSYVSMNPRFTRDVSRQVQGLDLGMPRRYSEHADLDKYGECLCVCVWPVLECMCLVRYVHVLISTWYCTQHGSLTLVGHIDEMNCMF